MGVAIKGQCTHPCCHGNVLIWDRINVSVLAVMCTIVLQNVITGRGRTRAQDHCIISARGLTMASNRR